MKKEAVALLSFLSSILLIPLISAQFTISDLASYIDAQSVFIIVCFGVLGLFLSTILNRFAAFRGTTAGIMSLLLSLGMTWGINKWINLNGLLAGIGFSGDILPYLLVLLLIVLIVFLWKFKWIAFWISGLIMVLISLFTDWIYETGIVLIAGIIFMIIGTLWWWRKKKGKKIRLGLLMIILGLLIGAYGFYIGETLYMIIGGIIFLLGIIFWIKKKASSPPGTVNGIRRLILEAKAYRQIADRYPNPKMYRNWARFIEYLKGRGYGRNENEICRRMMVTEKNISDVVKKYIR